MQLSDHIRTLLRDHDCVIIPDFGGLIAEYEPARIHPVRHTLVPPAKRVAFNQSLTRNDGLLVDALSRALDVSTAQARQLVREAVLRMQEELETGQRAELRGIGLFRRAAGRGLEFEYTGSQNLLNASFGLPELVSRPIRATDAMMARERPAPAPLLSAARTSRATRAARKVAMVVIAGLVLSANYMAVDMLGYLPENWRISMPSVAQNEQPVQQPVMARQQAALASEMTAATPDPVREMLETPAPAVTPAVAKPTVAVAKKPVVAKPVARKPVVASVVASGAQKAPAKSAAKAKTKVPGWEKAAATNATSGAESATIKSRTGRYYIIAGSYTSLANAEKGRQALVRLGHPARVILPQAGSRQYKLSVADYADRTSADREAQAQRRRLGNTLWVLNY
ncbi:Sporulation related domain-containing protein [Hymenobacter gelipurpurascens]|uniref:Sporulation related domain-containing protein n=1 Tax=Hymenobacter gelipurpurascens TaxID=89968 RepID=A0A212TAZ0_9BACT|nr:SPOR domain-containing protein [Hymenobacter gelipurpurascens]SNC63213.1 Sporulation related domain-containing protein [Hymenobacter gelipurpurascens]